MGEVRRGWLWPGAALCLLAIAGCTVSSVPISEVSERQLQKNAIAGEKLGFHVMPGGKQYRIQLFQTQFPERPVVVPMDRNLGGLPSIRMSLNGRKSVPFVVDSGAQMSVVEAELAISAKAEVYAPTDGMFRVAGVGGEERVYLARFAKAAVGSMEFSDFVTVLRRHTSTLRFGGLRVGEFDVNLFGAPVLSAFSYVTFDYPASRFVFSGQSSYSPGPRAIRIPLTVRDSMPYVPLKIGKRTFDALVDTGARDQLFLNDEVVRELGLQARAQGGTKFKAAGLGGMIRGTTFKLPMVHMGEFPIEDIVVDSSTGPWRARIGTELLERWRVTFDFRGGSLWLESPAR